MNKAFEKILERLEEKLRKSEKRYYRYLDDSNLSCMFDRSDIEEKRVDTINEILEIVQEVAEEYGYLSKGFNNGLLKRISDYFSSVYEGDDKTAPKMELSVYELREIASLHVEKCRLQTEIDKSKEYNGWIPCSERLPEEYGEYLVWWTDITGKQYYEITEYEPENGWIGDIPQAVQGKYNVIAWQPLPEPYQPKGE